MIGVQKNPLKNKIKELEKQMQMLQDTPDKYITDIKVNRWGVENEQITMNFEFSDNTSKGVSFEDRGSLCEAYRVEPTGLYKDLDR